MRLQTKFVTNQVLDTTKKKYTVPIDRDKYLYGINLHFRGRHRVTAAATTANPEGILDLVERVRLRMTHEIFGTEIPLDMYGPSLYYYRSFYTGHPDRMNLSAPMTVQVQDTDFDFELSWQAPPELIFPADQEFYILDAPRCSLLELDIEWGNAAGPVEGGTTSLTDIELTTGNPSVDIELVQVLDKEDLPLVALCKRVSSELDISATPFPVTNDKIQDLATGESIRSIMLKQYTRSTTAGQPTSVVATLLNPIKPEVDAGLTRIGVRVNEKYVRHWRTWPPLQAWNKKQYSMTAVPIGYGIIEFVDDGNIDRVLFTQDFVERRMRLDLAGSVVTGTSNRIERTLTTIRPNPRLK